MQNSKIESKNVSYQIENRNYCSYMSYDRSHEQSRPIVIIAHAWAGLSDFERKQAEIIASWGFCAFAIDLYGEGVLGKSTEENQKLMAPFLEERSLITKRIKGGILALQNNKIASSGSMAAIGFCFGGLCVLDSARTNLPNLAGVVSLHGLLKPLDKPLQTQAKIKPSLLVLNGHADPMVSAQDLANFQEEMNAKNADWQLHQFSQTQHGFTVPSCNSPELGARYNEKSAQRSMLLTKNFLAEMLL